MRRRISRVSASGMKPRLFLKAPVLAQHRGGLSTKCLRLCSFFFSLTRSGSQDTTPDDKVTQGQSAGDDGRSQAEQTLLINIDDKIIGEEEEKKSWDVAFSR